MSSDKVLLSGISDFWTRFFEDTDLIQDFHKATLEMVAEAYKKQMLSLMRMSLTDTPLLETVPWHPLFLTSNSVIPVVSAAGGETRYLVPLPEDIRSTELLQDSPRDTKYVLERGFDFELIDYDSDRLFELSLRNPSVPPTGAYLAFYEDPFSEEGLVNKLRTAVRKQPSRRVLTDKAISNSTQGIKFQDLVPNPFLDIVPGNIVRLQYSEGVVIHSPVHSVSDTEIRLSDYMPGLEDSELVSYSVGTAAPTFDDIIPVRTTGVLSEEDIDVTLTTLWMPDASKDYYSLHDLYGFSFSPERELSTESYRAYVTGLWNLYVNGPSPENLESALNISAGMPVVIESEETILEYDSRDPSEKRVVTDFHTHKFLGNATIRADVIAAAETVNGEVRGNLLTLFTDTIYLQNHSSFLLQGIEVGDTLVSYMEDPGGNPLGIPDFSATITRVTDVLLQVSNADALSEDHFAVVGDNFLSWAVFKASGEVAPATAAAHYPNLYPGDRVVRSGQFVRNTAVPLTLNRLSPLTSEFIVTDTHDDPTWWHDMAIPPQVVPGMKSAKRRVNTFQFDNLVNVPSTVSVGDIGLYVGRNENNEAPSDDFLNTCSFLTVQGVLTNDVDSPHMPTTFINAGVAPGHTLVLYRRLTAQEASTLLQEDFAGNNDPEIVQEEARVTITYVGAYTVQVEAGSIPVSDSTDLWFSVETSMGDVVVPLSPSFQQGNPEAPNPPPENVHQTVINLSAVGESPIQGSTVWRNYGTVTSGPGKRHTMAYILMDKFLKHNMFSVTYDSDNDTFNRSRSFYMDLILSAKPANTYPYIAPQTDLRDSLDSPEDNDTGHVVLLAPQAGVPEAARDTVGSFENFLMVGSRSPHWIRVFDDDPANPIGDLSGFSPNGNLVLDLYEDGTANILNQVVIPLLHVNSFSKGDGTFDSRLRIKTYPSEGDTINDGWDEVYGTLRNDFTDLVTVKIRDDSPSAGEDGIFATIANCQVVGTVVGQPGLFVGGMDLLIDQHEILNSDPSEPPFGMPGAYHADDFNSAQPLIQGLWSFSTGRLEMLDIHYHSRGASFPEYTKFTNTTAHSTLKQPARYFSLAKRLNTMHISDTVVSLKVRQHNANGDIVSTSTVVEPY